MDRQAPMTKKVIITDKPSRILYGCFGLLLAMLISSPEIRSDSPYYSQQEKALEQLLTHYELQKRQRHDLEGRLRVIEHNWNQLMHLGTKTERLYLIRKMSDTIGQLLEHNHNWSNNLSTISGELQHQLERHNRVLGKHTHKPLLPNQWKQWRHSLNQRNNFSQTQHALDQHLQRHVQTLLKKWQDVERVSFQQFQGGLLTPRRLQRVITHIHHHQQVSQALKDIGLAMLNVLGHVALEQRANLQPNRKDTHA